MDNLAAICPGPGAVVGGKIDSSGTGFMSAVSDRGLARSGHYSVRYLAEGRAHGLS